ncbi:hypothetical protein [Streptomyces sp. NPDC057460]|uniref:ATP-dependent DNA ligase n=1 Tax=Streptomyces sp. NPDC057460 TaxID=3346141 RepID=UPI0036C49537
MEFPIKVALAQAVPTLPEGPGWWFEPKFDGHRVVLRRTDDTVILYARSGRVVTPYWMDLALAGMAPQLRPGTVLDGEAVIWRERRLDFGAARSRAASSVTRARALAAQHPASYACWDLVQHPDPAIGDTRTLPINHPPTSKAAGRRCVGSGCNRQSGGGAYLWGIFRRRSQVRIAFEL